MYTTEIDNWKFEGNRATFLSPADLYCGKFEVEVVFTGKVFDISVHDDSSSETYGDQTNVEIPVEVFDRVRGVK